MYYIKKKLSSGGGGGGGRGRGAVSLHDHYSKTCPRGEAVSLHDHYSKTCPRGEAVSLPDRGRGSVIDRWAGSAVPLGALRTVGSPLPCPGYHD